MSTPSLAEKYRAHRRAFELALELGCTPREAERVLRRRDLQRLRSCGTRALDLEPPHSDFAPIDISAGDFRQWNAGWMMRD